MAHPTPKEAEVASLPTNDSAIPEDDNERYSNSNSDAMGSATVGKSESRDATAAAAAALNSGDFIDANTDNGKPIITAPEVVGVSFIEQISAAEKEKKGDNIHFTKLAKIAHTQKMGPSCAQRAQTQKSFLFFFCFAKYNVLLNLGPGWAWVQKSMPEKDKKRIRSF